MEMDSRLPSEGSSQASSAPTTLSSLSDDVLVHIVREGLGVYDVIAVRRVSRYVYYLHFRRTIDRFYRSVPSFR